jgi:hypothetical protein
MDWIHLAQDRDWFVGSFEHDDETSGSIKDMESAACSWLR